MDKVLILGANGLIGHEVTSKFTNSSAFEVLSLTRKDLDVTHSSFVDTLRDIAPDVLINCVGLVGGVQTNLDFPVDLLTENSQTLLSIASASHQANVEKMIILGSACMYPANLRVPATPLDLWCGKPEETSLSYAASKLLGVEVIRSYRKQYGRSWSVIVPTNIFGARDYLDGSSGHVINMLVKKFLDAKEEHRDSVEVWGTGKATRDFLYLPDLGTAIYHFVVKNLFSSDVTNIAGMGEISISDLAVLIAKVTNYDGDISFNNKRPEGALSKLLDDRSFRATGWKPEYSTTSALEHYISCVQGSL